MSETLKNKAEQAKEKLKKKLSRRKEAPAKGREDEKLLGQKEKEKPAARE